MPLPKPGGLQLGGLLRGCTSPHTVRAQLVLLAFQSASSVAGATRSATSLPLAY